MRRKLAIGLVMLFRTNKTTHVILNYIFTPWWFPIKYDTIPIFNVHYLWINIILQRISNGILFSRINQNALSRDTSENVVNINNRQLFYTIKETPWSKY